MTRSRALGLASCCATALAAACGFSANGAKTNAFASSGAVVGASSGNGGAGGGTLTGEYTGGSNSPAPTLAALCGGGCTPGTGKSDPCTLPGGGGAGGAGGAQTGACQLTYDGRKISGACGATGSAQNGQPCLSSHDCAPGYGCVGAGVCRAYCCADLEACAPQSYCAAAPLAAPDAPKSGVSVPACLPVSPCTLLDDKSCAKAGQTCTIVRLDGTTSCVDPGAGTDGESCPCAAGYVCSFAKDKCLKLCHTQSQGDCPAGYQCSGGSKPYPPGYGVCVQL